MGKRGEEMQTAVLAILRDSKSPHSAYTLLDRLQETYPKLRLQPCIGRLLRWGSVARYIVWNR